MGGDAITAMARRIVRENPDHPARGLARMLVQESRNALTLEQARNLRYGEVVGCELLNFFVRS